MTRGFLEARPPQFGLGLSPARARTRSHSLLTLAVAHPAVGAALPLDSRRSSSSPVDDRRGRPARPSAGSPMPAALPMPHSAAGALEKKRI